MADPEKRKVPERISLLKYAKIEFVMTFSVMFTLIGGVIWIMNWGIGLTNAQAAQDVRWLYFEKVITTQNMLLDKQNIIIEKIDGKIAAISVDVNNNRLEYLGLVSEIRSENKNRSQATSEKQDQILTEIKKGRNQPKGVKDE